jgi:hypothetical protein
MTLATILDARITLARRAIFVWRFRHQERFARFRRGLAYAFAARSTRTTGTRCASR